MPRRKHRPPQLKDQPRLAIAKRLAADAKTLGGFKPLARAITDAYLKNVIEQGWRPDGEFVIPRTKLSKLTEYDREVALSGVEIEALDIYFDHDLTRCPLLEFPSLVQDLAQHSEATIFVPSRFSSEEGPMTNYWDNHGVAEIQRAVNLHEPTIKFNPIYVQRRQERPGTNHGQWQHLFGKKGPPVLISIGSPRSSRPTEKALERMFNRTRKTKGWDNLPFSFVFLSNGDSAESKFSRPLEDLAATHPDLAAYVSAKKGWGLIAGQDSFRSQAAVKRRAGSATKKLETKIHSYGVIAAQRQGEQLVVVLAGLTGPGSLVAAAGLGEMTENLPQVGDPLEHAVLWAVVEATVNTEQMWSGGPQQLQKLRFAIPPTLWDPKLRRPVKRDEPVDPKKSTSPKAKTNKGKPPKSASAGGAE